MVYRRLSRVSGVELVAISTAMLLGCGKPAPDLAKVRGQLFMQEQPMRSVAVTFRPVGSTPGSGAVGATDADGRFEMNDVRGGEGVRPGQYRVHLYPSPGDPGASKIQAAVLTSTNKVPSIYINPNSSPILATVPAEGVGLDIRLTPDGQNITVESRSLAD